MNYEAIAARVHTDMCYTGAVFVGILFFAESYRVFYRRWDEGDRLLWYEAPNPTPE